MQISNQEKQNLAPPRQQTICVAIGHICPVYRAGLRAVLSDARDIAVVGDVGASEPLIALAETHKPDVVLIDGNLVDALDVVDQLRLARVRIFVFASSSDEEVFFQFLRHGAHAYENVMLPGNELVAKLRCLARGECLMSFEQRERLAPKPKPVQERPSPAIEHPEEIRHPSVPLSLREIEVLGYIASGYSNKEVARALDISEQTIKNHMTSIMKKMDVADRTSAVVYAIRAELIHLDTLPASRPAQTARKHTELATHSTYQITAISA